ncbi:MAG: ABC transporter ATP-binding protein [Ornithinimicrobium sp.]
MTERDATTDADPTVRTLPIASSRVVLTHTRRLVGEHRIDLAAVVIWHVLAALAGVVGPWVIGALVDALVDDRSAPIGTLILILALAVLAETVFVWAGVRASFILGERVFAGLRERFMVDATALPLSTVERAGTGDLLARTTNDVESLSHAVRFAVPTIIVSAIAISLTAVAAFVADPLVALALLVAVPFVVLPTRWFLRRAPAAYQVERAAYAAGNGVFTESVEGARTIEALSLQADRADRLNTSIAAMYAGERRTLFLRSAWFPALDFSFVFPIAVVVAWGAYLIGEGSTTVGTVTTVGLYALRLGGPMDELLMWLDELTLGATSLSRILGVSQVPPDRHPSGATPSGPQPTALNVNDVRYSYRDGVDVLDGITVHLRPGERLAIVGPSGAGKSTLGRLLAGIDGPRAGSVTVGGVPLIDLPLDQLRREVALVTQEHHIFVGSVRDNVVLARPHADDQQVWSALAAVDATTWVKGLDHGLDTLVGSGKTALSDAQAQQVALARLVLADPHTLVLDEATSLLDPRAARHLERSLAAVLHGRTVVAIAHRLHTAHDADRVAVVEDGQIIELGTHDQLIARDGSYAALWHQWSND